MKSWKSVWKEMETGGKLLMFVTCTILLQQKLCKKAVTVFALCGLKYKVLGAIKDVWRQAWKQSSLKRDPPLIDEDQTIMEVKQVDYGLRAVNLSPLFPTAE